MNDKVVCPLDTSLSPSMMKERIIRFNPFLKAIRDWQEPSERPVPHVLVKNNIGLSGFRTSAGAKVFENLYLDDAFCIKQLKNHQVDIFGTTNMTELAGFVTTQKSELGYSQIGGFPKNPYGSDYPPRGSSTGSAIAVAAGLCDAALGTETRGSLMLPGLANGVFAFKPSRGSISRSGIIPLALSLDAPGLLARNVETIRTLFHFMAVEDKSDALSKEFYARQKELDTPSDFDGIGFLITDNDQQKKESVQWVCDIIEKRGFRTKFIVIPPTNFDYKEISSTEFVSGMNQFLKQHNDQLAVSNYDEFINFYRHNNDTHPYGMDRLEDALAFSKQEPSRFKELVKINVHKAQTLVDDLMNQKKLVALASLDFVDWWSIGGGPSLVLPMQKKTSRPPLSIVIGSSVGSDETLLEIAEKLI